MAKHKVDKDMNLGQVVQKFPQSAEVMMKYGLHCVGCHIATWETIEQGAMGHGMSKEDIDKMVEEINDAVNKGSKPAVSHKNSTHNQVV